jgi:hypothetical protein
LPMVAARTIAAHHSQLSRPFTRLICVRMPV